MNFRISFRSPGASAQRRAFRKLESLRRSLWCLIKFSLRRNRAVVTKLFLKRTWGAKLIWCSDVKGSRQWKRRKKLSSGAEWETNNIFCYFIISLSRLLSFLQVFSEGFRKQLIGIIGALLFFIGLTKSCTFHKGFIKTDVVSYGYWLVLCE